MSGDVRTSGPLFDGRAEAALHRGVDHARHELAQRGKDKVKAAFAGSIRDDRGRFLASITTTDHSVVYTSVSGRHSYSLPVIVDDPATEEAVTTDLATYGPWLEGVGSRNLTTRFKGYHGFRRAGQELDGEAGGIADEAIRPYVDEMN